MLGGHEDGHDEVTTELRRHPVEFGVGWAFTHFPIELAAEWALLVDRVMRSTRSATEPLIPTEDSARWVWAASTRLRGSLSVAPSVHVYSTIGADFLLIRFDYVVRRESGAEEPVASLLPVRPRAELGLELDIW